MFYTILDNCCDGCEDNVCLEAVESCQQLERSCAAEDNVTVEDMLMRCNNCIRTLGSNLSACTVTEKVVLGDHGCL